MCLSDDRRDALQQDLCDRVRRVNPAATENVTGAMLGASFALESGAMIEAIGEDDLVTMLNDVDEVYHLSLRNLTVKTAKVLKDAPVGIPKAFVTAAAKEDMKTVTANVQPAIALLRWQFWRELLGSGVGPTEQAIDEWLRHDDELEDLFRRVNAEATLPGDVANSAGHVMTIFVGGLVLWQFAVDGRPTKNESLLSAGRDVFMAGLSVVQLGALTSKYILADGNQWPKLLATIETAGSFLSKVSTAVTFTVNLVGFVRYIIAVPPDYVGATLLFFATAATGGAFVLAVTGAAPLAAVASTVATVLVLIDVARKYLAALSEDREAFHRRHSAAAALRAHGRPAHPRARRVQPAARRHPRGRGDRDRRRALPDRRAGGDRRRRCRRGLVDRRGHRVDVRPGRRGRRRFLFNPIPAVVTSSPGLDEQFPVLAGDTLITVRPRFESWIEAKDWRGLRRRVREEGPVRARERGRGDPRRRESPCTARRHGRRIETLEVGGLPFERIRIWAGACP